MMLNLDQDDYIREVTETAGVRVVIAQPGHVPFPEDVGFTASPGYSTMFWCQEG